MPSDNVPITPSSTLASSPENHDVVSLSSSPSGHEDPFSPKVSFCHSSEDTSQKELVVAATTGQKILQFFSKGAANLRRYRHERTSHKTRLEKQASPTLWSTSSSSPTPSPLLKGRQRRKLKTKEMHRLKRKSSAAIDIPMRVPRPYKTPESSIGTANSKDCKTPSEGEGSDVSKESKKALDDKTSLKQEEDNNSRRRVTTVKEEDDYVVVDIEYVPANTEEHCL
uniref:Uncharacterized protein n=1 Tax=Amphimedon queenslandica TaxID=400682 RepID=A0A1X7VMR2_AMPQE